MDSELQFDLYGCYEGGTMPPVLAVAFRYNVNRFLVEFLDQQGTKPHVTFKFNFANTFQVQVDGELETINGCRLSMDFIKLLSYAGSSLSSYASFDFDVGISATLHTWVYEILHLTEFDFRPANDQGNLAGCRDFISQSMITWNRRGLVSWNWSRQEPSLSNSPISGLEQAYRNRGFHVLIGNIMWKEPSPSGNGSVTKAMPRSITPGSFRNHGVLRVTEYHGHRIPYRATV